MRIAYHPDAATTLSQYALDAWVLATLSGFPTVGAGTLVAVRDPSLPFLFDANTVADDRATQGGVNYSVVRFSGQVAELNFNNLTTDEVALWRDIYDATLGFRKPVIVEHPLTGEVYAMVGSGDWPFRMVAKGFYSGTVSLREAL